MLQLIESRVLSVVCWYHLVFFAISIAMFGLTAGAVYVYRTPGRFTPKTLSYDLSYFSNAMAVSTALSLGLQMSLAPIYSFSFTVVLVWAIFAIAIGTPFFFAGIVVSAALTRSPYPVGIVYGVDLAGAAFGCLGVLLLLNATDGPSALLWSAVVAAIASAVFTRSGIGTKPDGPIRFAWLLERRGVIIVTLAIIAFGNGLTKHGIQPLIVKDQIQRRDSSLALEKWNSFSRVAALSTEVRHPYLWGPSPTLPAETVAEDRYIDIDGSASTSMYRFDGDTSKVSFLKYDLTNLAYFLPGRNKVAIIGVGGGRDVLSAWIFGSRDITGVEINPILVNLLTTNPSYANFAGLRSLPDVRFHIDEARSWFARTQNHFDLIQMSMIDTWAATGAGAFTLTENGLYTLEAWKLFLGRLTPTGVLTVSRWYGVGEVNETGRMVSLAVAALMNERALDPKQHLIVASVGPIASLIVSRSPFSAEEIGTIRAAAGKYQYQILVSPDQTPQTPVLAGILGAKDMHALERATRDLPLDLTPPTDDRPFFFNQLPLGHPMRMVATLASIKGQTGGVARGNLLATATLMIIISVSVVLVLFTIVIPARPAIRDVGKKLVWSGTAYFLLIGLGFMMLEIALLQQMSVFLGHPVYSLSVVLFSLILSTGIGSVLSDRLQLDKPYKVAVWVALTSGLIVALTVWMHPVLASYDGAALFQRCVICVATITPCGILLGFGFPTGMRLVSRIDSRPMPWFWGVNGAASVLASGLAIGISIAFGIHVAFFCAALCYLLLIPAGAFGLFRAIDQHTSEAALAAVAAKIPGQGGFAKPA